MVRDNNGVLLRVKDHLIRWKEFFEIKLNHDVPSVAPDISNTFVVPKKGGRTYATIIETTRKFLLSFYSIDLWYRICAIIWIQAEALTRHPR